MEQAIADKRPPADGVVPALDRRPGGLDYLPHAYLAIAIVRSSGDCAAARRAVEDSGHMQAVASASARGKDIARQAREMVDASCPAQTQLPKELIDRARELLRRLEQARSDVQVLDERGNSLHQRSTTQTASIEAALSSNALSQLTESLRSGELLVKEIDDEIKAFQDLARSVAQVDPAIPVGTEAAANEAPDASQFSAELLARADQVLAKAQRLLSEAERTGSSAPLTGTDERRSLDRAQRSVSSGIASLNRAMAQENEDAARAALTDLDRSLAALTNAQSQAERFIASQSSRPPEELLRVIAAYLSGDLEAVLRAREGPDFSPGARAHLNLLQAAALHQRAKLDVSRSQEARSVVLSRIRAAKSADPSLAPHASFFAPDFRELYRNTASGG